MVFVLLVCLFLLNSSWSPEASGPTSDCELQLLDNRGQLYPPGRVSVATAIKLPFAQINQVFPIVGPASPAPHLSNYSFAANLSTGSYPLDKKQTNLEIIQIGV